MNTFMKVAIVSSVVVLLTSGCAATSTYKNYSTREGNRVEATGQAAIAAGASHSSHNCINCTSGYAGYRQPQYGYQHPGVLEDSASRITQSASSAASSAISSVIYQSIYGALR